MTPLFALSHFFFFQAEDGIRDPVVTGVQTCALPICRRVDGACDDEFALGLPLHPRAVLRGGGLTFSSYVHLLSPSVSIPRQQCPTRRSARPRAGDTSRSMPPLLPVRAARACRSARAQPSLC